MNYVRGAVGAAVLLLLLAGYLKIQSTLNVSEARIRAAEESLRDAEERARWREVTVAVAEPVVAAAVPKPMVVAPLPEPVTAPIAPLVEKKKVVPRPVYVAVPAPKTVVPVAVPIVTTAFASPEAGDEVLVQSGGVTNADVYRLLRSDKTTTELKRHLDDIDVHVRCDLDKAIFFNTTRTVMYIHPCVDKDEHFCKTFCFKAQVGAAATCPQLGTATRRVAAAESMSTTLLVLPPATSSSVRAGGQAMHWTGPGGCLSIFFEADSGGSGDMHAVKALCTKQCAPSKFYTESPTLASD